MNRHNVRDTGDALAYITECTLATVCNLAMRKTPPTGELRRQTSIAQMGIDWMREMNVTFPPRDRTHDVLNLHKGSVEEWAKQFRRERG